MQILLELLFSYIQNLITFHHVIALSIITTPYASLWACLVIQMVEHLPAMRETQVPSLSWEDPLEKEMATHSSTLGWTEEPGRLQSMGSQRVRHD